MGSSVVQGKMWGSRARDWADFGESTSNDLFNAILQKTKVVNGAKLLDVGCGAGKFCKIASGLGFKVSGFDASESLIAIARERMPNAEFQSGDMEELPYPDQSFDVVTGINSFQFAGDIENALREAKRVTKRDGRVIIAVWGKPEDCEASLVFSALGPYMPPPPPPNEKTPARKPLYTEGVLEDLAEQSGLNPGAAEEIVCIWDFEDEETALRGMLSAGLIALAIQNAGEQKITETVAEAIKQFKQKSGRVKIKNTFRCLTSKA